MLNTAVEDGLLRSNPCKVKGAGAEHATSVRSPCPTRWRTSLRPSIRSSGPWCFWPPTARSASVSWPACAALASTCCTAP